VITAKVRRPFRFVDVSPDLRGAVPVTIMLQRALLEERLADALAHGDRELVSRTRATLADLIAGRRERFLLVVDLVANDARAPRARPDTDNLVAEAPASPGMDPVDSGRARDARQNTESMGGPSDA
jgi:hypothetical protein